MKHCKIHHFADDTNLLNFSHSIKKMNKQVNYDLKNLIGLKNNWLSANKICHTISKTEIILYKSLKKQTDSDLHLKLNGKRLYPTNSMKYLVIIIDKNLIWHPQTNNVTAKLNRANVMLSKRAKFLLVTSYQLLVTSYYLLVASYQLLVTSYQSLVTSHQLLVPSYQSLVTSHQLIVTSYQSLFASHQLLVTSYQLLVTTSYWSIVTSHQLLTTLIKIFSSEVCEIFQKSFLIEHL